MMGQSLRSAVCSSNTSFCRPGATLIDVPPPGELNMSMTQWAEFVYKSVRSCTFTDELDGSHKRFAIAEAALIVGGIAAAGTLAVAIPVLGFGFATLGAVIGSTSMAIALGTPAAPPCSWRVYATNRRKMCRDHCRRVRLVVSLRASIPLRHGR